MLLVSVVTYRLGPDAQVGRSSELSDAHSSVPAGSPPGALPGLFRGGFQAPSIVGLLFPSSLPPFLLSPYWLLFPLSLPFFSVTLETSRCFSHE